MRPDLPPRASNEYLWWARGTADEAAARDEGMTADARRLRELLEGLARLRGVQATTRQLVLDLANVECPDVLRRRHRI